MMFGEDGFHGFWSGGFMWLLWIVLIIVLVYIFRDFTGTGKKTTSSDDDALDILRKRYARGEIDEAEYERRKSELET